ncbi:MAG: heme biosynthesis protein HemY [Gammaproteobacteria bacterium]|jgi:HemY protein
MKLLIYILAIFFIAVIAGLLAQQDPGYVLIGRGFQTVEITLSLFITLQILLFAALYFLIRFVSQTWGMKEKIHNWRLTSRHKKARDSLRRGMIELAQGHWKQAERALTRHVEDYDMPLLNYLSAARAAQKLDAPERRDHYLSEALKSMPEADMAVELTQAELQIAHNQMEQALATLVHLRTIAPKHTHVLLLLSKIYEQLKSWGDLEALLPDLKKYKVIDNNEYERITIIVYCAMLDMASATRNKGRLYEVWNRMPGKLHDNTKLIKNYASNLLELEDFDRCENLLQDSIKHHWDNELVHLYGKTKSSQPEKQLHTAESWLKGKENNPELLLCLGRLSIYNKFWGQARSFLESSLGYGPKPETYKELALLLEQMDEKETAADCYKKGLLLAMRHND